MIPSDVCVMLSRLCVVSLKVFRSLAAPSTEAYRGQLSLFDHNERCSAKLGWVGLIKLLFYAHLQALGLLQPPRCGFVHLQNMQNVVLFKMYL